MAGRVEELLTFREASSWRDAGMLLALQSPMYAGVVLWLCFRDVVADYFGLVGKARGMVPAFAWVSGCVLMAKLMKVALPALVNSWAARRWGGPTARTDRWMVVIFYLVTFADELLQIAAGLIVYTFLMDRLNSMRPRGSEDFRFWLFYLGLFVALGYLGNRAATRLKGSVYVGRA